MTLFEKMKASFGPLFKAIPKGKFGTVFMEAQTIESGVAQMANVFDKLRDYFLGSTGEESPFVKLIDKLVPRQPKE